MFKQSTMVFTDQTGLEKLYNIVSYCVDQKQCRRTLIAEHFLETMEEMECNAMCDHCEYSRNMESKDVSDYGKTAVAILRQAKLKEIRLTGLKLVEALMGKGPNNVKMAGWKGRLSKEDTERVLINLILEGFIKEDFHYTAYSTISYLLPGPREVLQVEMDFVKGSPKKKPQSAENGSSSNKPQKSKIVNVEMDFMTGQKGSLKIKPHDSKSSEKESLDKKANHSKSAENGSSSKKNQPQHSKTAKRKAKSDTEDSDDEIMEVKKKPKTGNGDIIAIISDSDDDFVF